MFPLQNFPKYKLYNKQRSIDGCSWLRTVVIGRKYEIHVIWASRCFKSLITRLFVQQQSTLTPTHKGPGMRKEFPCHDFFIHRTKSPHRGSKFNSNPHSVCPFVTPLSLCSHHRIIMKFSGVITIDGSGIHAKDQGQRSKGKVTKVKNLLSRFRTVTTVWIHTWRRNDAQSLILLRRGALWIFMVIHQISRAHNSKILDFDPNWSVTPVLIHQWLRNCAQSFK